MLKTKLYRPPITSDLVMRSELIAHLENHRHLPLTLVSAPAGYGKSITISQWLENSDFEFVWISLDSGFNDLKTFLEYLVSGFNSKWQNILQSVERMISAPEIPPVEVIAEEVINQLDQIDQDFVLVLDDYHLIQTENVHRLIEVLLQYIPQHLHLVIITRRDPPLDIHQMKVYGRVYEIRMKELSFSKDEVGELFKLLIDYHPSKQELKTVIDMTEGWIVSLRLAFLSGGLNFTMDRFNQLVMNGMPGMEYLVKEAISQQEASVKSWILLGSLVDEFNSELIEAMAETINTPFEDSKEILRTIKKANLFLISLDDQDQWFRYHHLFKDLLMIEAKETWNQDEINEIHLAAHNWYQLQGLLDEALEHALIGNHEKLAIDFVINHRYLLMNNEDWTRLNRWMELLPEEAISSNALLMTTDILLKEYQGQLNEFFLQVQSLINNLPHLQISESHRNMFEGELSVIMGELAFIEGDGEKATEQGKKSLELVPKNSMYVKTFAMYWYSFGFQMMGSSEKGEVILLEALEDRETYSMTSISRLYIALSALHFMCGNLRKTMYWANQCLEVAKENDLNESTFLAYSFISKVQFLRNKNEPGRSNFKQYYDLRYLGRGIHLVICSFPHIQSFILEGDIKKAEEVLEEVRLFVEEFNRPAWNEVFLMVEVDFLIQTKRWSELPPLVDKMNFEHAFPPAWFSYHTPLIPVKVLCLVPQYIDLDLALEKIDAFLNHGRRINNIIFMIATLAYKALIHWKREEQELAYEVLDEAILLSAKESIKRPIIDLGSEMKEFLESYQNVKNNPFVNELIQGFPSGVTFQSHVVRSKEEMDITPREMEILELVAEGFRNKEIAEKLFISPETVKRHMTNIYHKFDVHSRIELVKKAMLGPYQKNS